MSLSLAPNSPTAGSGTTGEQGAPSNWETDFRWLVAWLVLLLILAALSRTRFGQVVIYYALALMLLFLFVTQFHFVAQALAPFRTLGPGLSTEGPQGG